MIRTLTAITLLLAGPICVADTALVELAGLMQGRFDSHLPGTTSSEPVDQRIIDSRQPVAAPDIGSLVVYLQLNRGADLGLYRQRILVFDEDADGNLLQHAYTLRDPAAFVDAEADDEILRTLSRDDIDPVFTEGCEQVWTRTDSGFRGYVDPKTCIIISSRTGKPRRIEAETLITPGQLTLVERGFDEDFTQLFGTPEGHTTLLHKVPE